MLGYTAHIIVAYSFKLPSAGPKKQTIDVSSNKWVSHQPLSLQWNKKQQIVLA